MKKNTKKKLIPPKVGETIYVEDRCSISNGSSDVAGGKATVTNVTMSMSAGEMIPFVSVKEHPGHSYNWEFLAEKQTELKKRFGKKLAHPDPDVDRPWIEKGDIVNGKKYRGKDQW